MVLDVGSVLEPSVEAVGSVLACVAEAVPDVLDCVPNASPLCSCSMKACRSLVSCWNRAVVPLVELVLLELPLPAGVVSADRSDSIELVEVLVRARLLATRLFWVMLEIDT